jgi:hypothetical protein
VVDQPLVQLQVWPQDVLVTGGHLRGGVEGVPGDVCGPMVVTVVHTYGVNLLFVTLDAVRGTEVISEDPGLALVGGAGQGVNGTASVEGVADVCEISVDCVSLHGDSLHCVLL